MSSVKCFCNNMAMKRLCKNGAHKDKTFFSCQGSCHKECSQEARRKKEKTFKCLNKPNDTESRCIYFQWDVDYSDKFDKKRKLQDSNTNNNSSNRSSAVSNKKIKTSQGESQDVDIEKVWTALYQQSEQINMMTSQIQNHSKLIYAIVNNVMNVMEKIAENTKKLSETQSIILSKLEEIEKKKT